MSNEELQQRGYFTDAGLRGESRWGFERFNLGSTSVATLISSGRIPITLSPRHQYSPSAYKAPKTPGAIKPDEVLMDRTNGNLRPRVVIEHKRRNELGNEKAIQSAQEQALLGASALEAPVAVATDGAKTFYIDVPASISAGAVVLFDETGGPTPALLERLLTGAEVSPKDPTELASRVWQIIWHATKAEPKDCLLTFVEFFVLKFLSDNLANNILPKDHSFYALVGDEHEFRANKGQSEIEYYITTIRPKIKTIFPDNTVCKDESIPPLFGLNTIVSKTSIINGFAFLKSGFTSYESFNSTFRAIIAEFNNFGTLQTIDPEFKLRLYEKFLRRSARQQSLGQFFTPRNIVASMVKMAQLSKLPDGAVVLDPAAGVGGFILEPLMWQEALKDNLTISSGHPVRRVKAIGIDVDPDLHILAKANMLLHIAEIVRDPATTTSALNEAMAETFLLMNSNQTLGSLLDPPKDCIDVVLTNPPYVTRGSAIYKETIRETPARLSGTTLKEYYDGAGLGLESLFMRYVSGALKPGGRAFVIVPQGMLNRTEPGTKETILSECNLLASIQLPKNAFFNTAQKTYILALERRHTPVDPRPDVLCGIARTIGESLDFRRTPQPSENDLADIASAFVARDNGDNSFIELLSVCRLIPADEFQADDRWDVPRFWSEDELIALGEKSSQVERSAFLEATTTTLEELLSDIQVSRRELQALKNAPTKTVQLDDSHLFTVRSGTRIKTSDIEAHPPISLDDALPVYSCFKEARLTKGDVSAKWALAQTRRDRSKKIIPRYVREPHDVVTVNANGASVGMVFIRPAGCLITDDVIAVEVAENSGIDLNYFMVALQDSVTAGGFLYEAKLFATRVRELSVEIPISESGSFDLLQQAAVAKATKHFNELISRLSELGVTVSATAFV